MKKIILLSLILISSLSFAQYSDTIYTEDEENTPTPEELALSDFLYSLYGGHEKIKQLGTDKKTGLFVGLEGTIVPISALNDWWDPKLGVLSFKFRMYANGNLKLELSSVKLSDWTKRYSYNIEFLKVDYNKKFQDKELQLMILDTSGRYEFFNINDQRLSLEVGIAMGFFLDQKSNNKYTRSFEYIKGHSDMVENTPLAMKYKLGINYKKDLAKGWRVELGIKLEGNYIGPKTAQQSDIGVIRDYPKATQDYLASIPNDLYTTHYVEYWETETWETENGTYSETYLVQDTYTTCNYIIVQDGYKTYFLNEEEYAQLRKDRVKGRMANPYNKLSLTAGAEVSKKVGKIRIGLFTEYDLLNTSKSNPMYLPFRAGVRIRF